MKDIKKAVRMMKKKTRKEIRYGRNTYKQQQLEREAETERRKLVKSERVKVAYVKLFFFLPSAYL